jgi:hypothetical protein
MRSTAQPDQLGPVETRHPVDQGRRLTIVLAGVVVGMAFLLCYAALPDPANSRHPTPGAGRVYGAILGVGLAAFVVAAWYLARALRGGRGEYYEVRAHGLVHGNARRAAAWRWSDIAGVREIHLAKSWWRRLLGADYLCRVRLRSGRRFSVNGLTENHSMLGSALVERCPYLEDSTGGPPWVWATVLAVCVAGFVFCLGYVVSHPSTEERVQLTPSMMQTVYHDGLSQGEITALVLGFFGTFVFGLTSLIMLIRGRRMARKAA